MWHRLIIDVDFIAVTLTFEEVEDGLQQKQLMLSKLEYGLTTIACEYRVDGHLLWLKSVHDHLPALAQIVDIQLRIGLVDSIDRMVPL